MEYQHYETLRFDYEGRVLTVTIDAPGPVNAVNDRLHHELSRVFTDLQGDSDCDIIVLTGSGRAFCAGGDMDWFQEMIDDPRKFRAIGPEAKRIVFSLLDLEKPIICRLNGAAAGLGASIALLCDVIVASSEAVIGDPHVKVGLVAGDGGAVIWPQLIGYARAKEYLLTGGMLDASKAAEIGLINYAVPKEELDTKVAEIVAGIAANPRGRRQRRRRSTDSTSVRLKMGIGLRSLSSGWLRGKPRIKTARGTGRATVTTIPSR